MTGYAQLVTAIMAIVIAFGMVPPVAAQDDGVGFDDMTGIQEAVTRTFKSAEDRDLSAGIDAPRDLRKPFAGTLVTVVYRFDTEANAAASFELLKTDMNATGFQGQSLELTPVTLPVGLEYAAGTVSDTLLGDSYDITLVMALDGVHIYTVIGITAAGAPKAAVASTLNTMASGAVGPEPATLDPAGGASGGVWGKVPTLATIEREFRGIESVEDAAPFPA